MMLVLWQYRMNDMPIQMLTLELIEGLTRSRIYNSQPKIQNLRKIIARSSTHIKLCFSPYTFQKFQINPQSILLILKVVKITK